MDFFNNALNFTIYGNSQKLLQKVDNVLAKTLEAILHVLWIYCLNVYTFTKICTAQ